MKKVKMLLIAFSLLACSSLAFATRVKLNEENKPEIANFLNEKYEYFEKLKKELQKNNFFENGLLTILTNEKQKNEEDFVKEVAKNPKFKKLTFEDLALKIAKESLYLSYWKDYFCIIIKKEKDKLKYYKIPRLWFEISKLEEEGEYLELKNFEDLKNSEEPKKIEQKLKKEGLLFEDNLVKIIIDKNNIKIKEINLEEFKNNILANFSVEAADKKSNFIKYEVCLLKNEAILTNPKALNFEIGYDVKNKTLRVITKKEKYSKITYGPKDMTYFKKKEEELKKNPNLTKNLKEDLRTFKIAKNEKVLRIVEQNMKIKKEKLEDFVQYFCFQKKTSWPDHFLDENGNEWIIYFEKCPYEYKIELLKKGVEKNTLNQNLLITKDEKTNKIKIKDNIKNKLKEKFKEIFKYKFFENFSNENLGKKINKYKVFYEESLNRIKDKNTLEEEEIKIDDLFEEFLNKLEEKIENKPNFKDENEKLHFKIKLDGLFLKNHYQNLNDLEIEPIILDVFLVEEDNKSLNDDEKKPLKFELFLREKEKEEKEEEENKKITNKLKEKKLTSYIDRKLKNLKLLKNCNFKDLEFIKINTNTFEEEKPLSLDEFENEIVKEILGKEKINFKIYELDQEKIGEQKYLKRKSVCINNFILKNKKTNEIKPLNLTINYEEEETYEDVYERSQFKKKIIIKGIIKIYEGIFNRYLLENLVKNFIKNIKNNSNEKEKIKKFKNTEKLMGKNYKFNEKLFDKQLEKEKILNNGKIGILNTEKDIKIDYFSLEEFKEIAKKAVAYYGYSKPLIKNVIKKDSNGSFYCVDLELIYNEDENDNIIKIENLEKNQISSSYLNILFKNPNDNYLEENDLFYNDSLYSEILKRLENGGFILNNSIEIYDADENKIKKYSKKSFINLIRKKISKKFEFEKENKHNCFGIEKKNYIIIKNIINKTFVNCQNLELQAYILPKFKETSLNKTKKIEFYNYSFNQEDNEKYKKNLNTLEIEEVLNDEKMDEKIEDIEDLKKFRKITRIQQLEYGFLNEETNLNSLIKPAKEKIKELIQNIKKIYIKNYEKENKIYFDTEIKKDEIIPLPIFESPLIKYTENKKDEKGNKMSYELQRIFRNEIDKALAKQIESFLINAFSEKNLKKEKEEQIKLEFSNKEIVKWLPNMKLNLEKLPKLEPIKNCFTNLEYNNLKNAYLLHIIIETSPEFEVLKLVIPVETKEEFKKINNRFSEISNELKKNIEIIENTMIKLEFREFFNKIKEQFNTYSEGILKYKIKKKLQKSFEKKDFKDEYEIKIKNLKGEYECEKCDLIFKIFKIEKDQKTYYSLKDPKENKFVYCITNIKRTNENSLKLYSLNSNNTFIYSPIDVIYYDGNNFETTHFNISKEEKKRNDEKEKKEKEERERKEKEEEEKEKIEKEKIELENKKIKKEKEQKRTEEKIEIKRKIKEEREKLKKEKEKIELQNKEKEKLEEKIQNSKKNLEDLKNEFMRNKRIYNIKKNELENLKEKKTKIEELEKEINSELENLKEKETKIKELKKEINKIEEQITKEQDNLKNVEIKEQNAKKREEKEEKEKIEKEKIEEEEKKKEKEKREKNAKRKLIFYEKEKEEIDRFLKRNIDDYIVNFIEKEKTIEEIIEEILNLINIEFKNFLLDNFSFDFNKNYYSFKSTKGLETIPEEVKITFEVRKINNLEILNNVTKLSQNALNKAILITPKIKIKGREKELYLMPRLIIPQVFLKEKNLENEINSLLDDESNFKELKKYIKDKLANKNYKKRFFKILESGIQAAYKPIFELTPITKKLYYSKKKSEQELEECEQELIKIQAQYDNIKNLENLEKEKEELEEALKNCRTVKIELMKAIMWYPSKKAVASFKFGERNEIHKINSLYFKSTADLLFFRNKIKIKNLKLELDEEKIKKAEEEMKKIEEEIEKKREKEKICKFFTIKDEKKLKKLKIAKTLEDLNLIKSEIVNELEEEDLIKLKKITLAGKTPYVIPLKLEIEYNSENEDEKFKYFKLEVYYSVSLKGFKVKNIKLIEKEEYEKKEEKK